MSTCLRVVLLKLIALSSFVVLPTTLHGAENNAEKRKLVPFANIPAVIPIGKKGEFITDLHATLNDRMPGREIDPPEDYFIDSEGEADFLYTPKEKLRIPPHWQLPKQKTFDFKPKGRPIDSFGIYGEQTRLLILLFQITEDLPPTGELDAVTLQHLRPLLPASRAVLGTVMSWRWFKADSDDHSNALIEGTKLGAASLVALFVLIVAAVVLLTARFFGGVLDHSFKSRFLSNTKNEKQPLAWHLVNHGVFKRMSWILFGVLIYFAHVAYPDYWIHELDSVPWWRLPKTFIFWNMLLARLGLFIVIVSSTLLLTRGVIAAITEWMTPIGDGTGSTALRGIRTFALTSVWGIAMILIAAAISGTNPAAIVGSLGVLVAVFVVVFRDALLGLVASVHIVANDIVKKGDWVEIPKYGAEGTVEDITLNMIKVRNFDKTICTIPTPAILTEAFRNWSDMVDEGGRRIKRALYIDMNTIRQGTNEEQSRWQQLISEVVEGERETIQYDTNLGAFREYVEQYLQAQECIHPHTDAMKLLVRHLQPTPEGLPLELYAYCKETAFKDYERIQAEIVEHVLSMVPVFGLRVFQVRSGSDRGGPLEQSPQS